MIYPNIFDSSLESQSPCGISSPLGDENGPRVHGHRFQPQRQQHGHEIRPARCLVDAGSVGFCTWNHRCSGPDFRCWILQAQRHNQPFCWYQRAHRRWRSSGKDWRVDLPWYDFACSTTLVTTFRTSSSPAGAKSEG